jgi:hypothetical protein
VRRHAVRRLRCACALAQIVDDRSETPEGDNERKLAHNS